MDGERSRSLFWYSRGSVHLLFGGGTFCVAHNERMGVLNFTDKVIVSNRDLYFLAVSDHPALVSVWKVFGTVARLPSVVAIIPAHPWPDPDEGVAFWVSQVIISRVRKARWWLVAGFIARLRYRVRVRRSLANEHNDVEVQ